MKTAKFEMVNPLLALSVIALLMELGADFQVKRGAAFYFSVFDVDEARKGWLERNIGRSHAEDLHYEDPPNV